MNLHLTPNDYLDTSRAVYETALACQNARDAGVEAARADERKRKEREAKEAASLAKLKAGL